LIDQVVGILALGTELLEGRISHLGHLLTGVAAGLLALQLVPESRALLHLLCADTGHVATAPLF